MPQATHTVGTAVMRSSRRPRRAVRSKEMGSAWPEVVAKLSRDASYVRAFAAVYGDGLSGENVADAIAEYERSLITPGSRFDRYLRGDAMALSADEREGWRTTSRPARRASTGSRRSPAARGRARGCASRWTR
jgi:hypothetical protein